ncbi:MAG: ribulose-phosphate 3-epimerase [Calditrichaeota bacterium]|nr:MAG: ribulose-phosphate 3-epimerase [Calditrichota bacterium]MBL1206174.1 ribulose-phosphate 3-epimerase [Calditrichota bacterium]NOG45999.1 ribulose-phosphate 3-epimerase [Calditrichota bacterium]
MPRKNRKIAPSILSADFAKLGEQVKLVEDGGAGVIHVDVMDGHFVPNITIGPFIVKALRPVTQLPLDVHLMIENPGDYIDAFAKAGADYLTVHEEACTHLHRVIQSIKEKGVKAGIALNPHTPVSSIEEIVEDIDLILIMSVNPGFGGQKFISNALNKLRQTQQLLNDRGLNHIEVEVDGGVKIDNIKEISDAGAEIIVSGSGIYNTENPAATIQEMLKIVND